MLSNFDKIVSKYIVPFEEAGYNVKVKFVDVPVNVSMSRVVMRELENGRLINSSAAFSYGTKPLETYLKLADMTNSFGEKYGLTELSVTVSGSAGNNPSTGVPAPAFMLLVLSAAAVAASGRRKPDVR